MKLFLGRKVKRNSQVGTIKSWGPTSRVSVDLIINSFGRGFKNILSFTTGNNCCKSGDRVPSIFSHPTLGLHIVSSKNGKLYSFNYKGVKAKKKFNLVIEQASINEEVRFRRTQ